MAINTSDFIKALRRDAEKIPIPKADITLDFAMWLHQNFYELANELNENKLELDSGF